MTDSFGAGTAPSAAGSSQATTQRTYSSITSWEASLDDTDLYAASDDAVGECYADSDFDESVNIDGGGTVGLSSITLSVASGERHDGTAGTGVRLLATTNRTIDQNNTSAHFIEWMEWDGNGNKIEGTAIGITKNLLCHDISASGTTVRPLGRTGTDGSAGTVMNTIVYDVQGDGSNKVRGIDSFAAVALGKYYNCTVYNVGGSSNAYGMVIADNASEEVRNCISTGTATQDFFPSAPSNAVMDHNASEDGSDSGTGSITVTVSNEFVSTTGGSEDLHLKSGADCIDAGTDLGTTPSGVEIDIDGRDRDAQGDTWDIGADEFVSAAEDQNIDGSLLEDSDTLYHGLVEPIALSGSLLLDTDNLYHGEIVRLLQQIFSTFIENENILYHGIITHSLTNSLLEDADILHHGAISYDINNSLFQDADILYHGEFNISTGGSLFEDEDIFYNSVVIGNNSIEGTFLEDTDSLYHGKITHSILGQFLEDADTLYHGFISANLMGSVFEDEDIFYHGSVFSGNIEGSLYEDPDIFYHGLILGGVQTADLFRLLLNHLLNSNADFVNLADIITLQEQGATAETTEHLGILVDENTV